GDNLAGANKIGELQQPARSRNLRFQPPIPNPIRSQAGRMGRCGSLRSVAITSGESQPPASLPNFLSLAQKACQPTLRLDRTARCGSQRMARIKLDELLPQASSPNFLFLRSIAHLAALSRDRTARCGSPSPGATGSGGLRPRAPSPNSSS